MPRCMKSTVFFSLNVLLLLRRRRVKVLYSFRMFHLWTLLASSSRLDFASTADTYSNRLIYKCNVDSVGLGEAGTSDPYM